MRPFYLFAILGISFLLAVAACGQSKNTSRRSAGASYLQVLGATMEKSFPGVRKAEPVVNYKITVAWKGTAPPESFFWKSPEGWQNCNVYRPGKPATGDLRLAEIDKGDKLELVPTRKGKLPIPPEIPSNINNAVFFQVSGRKQWFYVQVKNLTRKPDVIMP